MRKAHSVSVLAMLGLLAAATNAGRAQSTPGQPAPNATLRLPWESPATPSALPSAAGVPTFGGSTANSFKPIPPYQEPPDPNQDVLVTRTQGPWMICVHWYSGKQAHQMARKMVMELRNNPQYRLPAYVFNRGAEKRRDEYERVKALVERHREFLIKNNLPPAPFRVRTQHIEEQCAILVGNYPDAEAARKALDEIRKLKPDPKRFDLSVIFRGKEDDKGNIEVEEGAYVNPFTSAFVVHNPLFKIERPAEWHEEDMGVLRKLNQGEDYSLLKCNKRYTLMVKQFLLPAVIQSKTAAGKFLETIGLGKTNSSDNAALNAHNMARLFRSERVKLEAYVLHTRYSSIVSVGAFDSPDDPALKSMQNLLVNQYKIPQAVPMQIPR